MLEQDIYESIKISYLLSVCDKLSDIFFTNMIKQYESKKIVATKHMFTLFITLFEPLSSDKQFYIKNVYGNFSNLNDSDTKKLLSLHNNKILNIEIPQIKLQLEAQSIILNDFQLAGILTVATLIKYYKTSGYKYIFIPLIIDYGRNSNLVHQAALIINFDGLILFYEPYGKYMKYNKSYADSICQLFKIFDNCGLFDNNIRCKTYHSYYGLETGIQTYLLKKNNNNIKNFCDEYDKIINDINHIFPKFELGLLKSLYHNNKDDDYIKNLLNILPKLVKYIKNKLLKEQPSLTDIQYNLFNRILLLYGLYNSETCVSITLIEMSYFFKQTSNITYNLQKMYSDFENHNNPNIILFKKLNMLMDTFNITEIRSRINNNMFNICLN
jgi:hypothetical protein